MPEPSPRNPRPWHPADGPTDDDHLPACDGLRSARTLLWEWWEADLRGGYGKRRRR